MTRHTGYFILTTVVLVFTKPSTQEHQHDEMDPVPQSKSKPAVSFPKSIKPITGTELYTGVFYKMSFASFPNGVLTFSDTLSKEGCTYLLEDLHPEELPYFKAGQKWELYSQWVFSPTDEVGWYTLENREFSANHSVHAFIVSGKDEVETELGQLYLMMCSDPAMAKHSTDKTGKWRDNAKWKVISFGQGKYKLMNKHTPKATFRRTAKMYGKYSHFIEIDTRAEHEGCYKPGGKWFNNVTLTFTPAQIKLGTKFYYLADSSTYAKIEETETELSSENPELDR